MATTSAEPRTFRTMPFGPHKGTPLSELPVSHLQKTIIWIDEKADDPEKFTDLRASLEQEIESRPNSQQPLIKKPMTTVPSNQLCSDIVNLGLLQKLHDSKSDEETKLIQEAGRYMRNRLNLAL